MISTLNIFQLSKKQIRLRNEIKKRPRDGWPRNGNTLLQLRSGIDSEKTFLL